jgi:hypothetical protein
VHDFLINPGEKIRPRSRWNLKVHEGVKWIQPAQYRAEYGRLCEHGHETSSFVKEVVSFLLVVVFPEGSSKYEIYSKAVTVVFSLRRFQFLTAIFLLLRASTSIFE